MLSVIIPVYNVENYIRECLESVVRQKTDDLEIIIINDGSTDKSEEICMEYKEAYPEIRYKKQKNAGLGDARNAGLALAKGEFVIFLDSDDYWREDLVKCVLECIRENPHLDILYFDSDVIYEDEEVERLDSYDARMYHRQTSVKDRLYKGSEFFLHTYPLHFNVQACMAVFRKLFLTECRIAFPEKIYYEDILFSTKAALKADLVRYLSMRLYQRRYHANSITTGVIDEKHISDYMRVIQLMEDFVCAREVLEEIRKEKLPYEALLYRKMKDRIFALVQTFFVMCRRYVGNAAVVLDLKKEIYGKVFRIAQITQAEKLHLEELEAFLYVDIQMEEDRKHGLPDLMAVSQGDSFDESIWRTFLNNCRRVYQKKAKSRLEEAGIFERDKKTGIYGGGNHTKGLLKAVRQFGELPVDLFLLDSYKISGQEEFERLPVINIRDIPADTDQIIISSFLYERELYENALKYAKKGCRINRLYQNEVRELCWQFISE